MNDPLSILIVDDDPMMAKTLADILTYRGYRITVAHSGPEALEKANTSQFDCVFSDIRMPGMSGLQLHQALRHAHVNIPTALMTAYSETHLMREGIEDGVAAVFTKPVDLKALFLFLQALPHGLEEFMDAANQGILTNVMTHFDLDLQQMP